jgi:hypothetical protein
MAGIFPSTGVTPANTQNGVTGITTTGCGSLFYRNNCNPRFDPVATNALISEILNASNAFGKAYDCSKLDNLKTALTAARDLCDLAVKSPDNDDFLAGCFDGASGLTSISALKALFALCTLPTTTAPDYRTGQRRFPGWLLRWRRRQGFDQRPARSYHRPSSTA